MAPKQGSGGMVPAKKIPRDGCRSVPRDITQSAIANGSRCRGSSCSWIQLLLILDLDLRLDVLFAELDVLAGDRPDQVRHRLSHRLLFAQRLLEAGDVREAG